MQIIYNRGNTYFDTYNIIDGHGQHIGIVEDHIRQIRTPYYVGWHAGNPSGNEYTKGWKTASFDKREDAILFAQGDKSAERV